MRIVLGADHAGFELKRELDAHVRALGHQVLDVGTHAATPPVDYPDFALAVALALTRGEADRGVLICGSGVGASVAANKVPGVRAAVCHDAYSAHQGVEHDNMNVLVLGSRIVAAELAKDLVRLYLDAQFTAAERHLRRLAKVAEIEARYLLPAPPVA